MKDIILYTFGRLITSECIATYNDILNLLRQQVAEGIFPGELYGLLESGQNK